MWTFDCNRERWCGVRLISRFRFVKQTVGLAWEWVSPFAEAM